VTVTSPSDGASYVRGEEAEAEYSCIDEDGDLETCTLEVVGTTGVHPEALRPPIDTSTVGEFDFTVTAVDGAGHHTVVTHHYRIVAPRCAGRPVTVMRTLGDRPTSGNDVILGSSASETIHAGKGNDVVCGLGGNDRVYGGAGNDRVIAAGGDDTVNGGNGNDALQGGVGPDSLAGGAGNDVLNGGADADTCDGQAGTNDRQSGCEVRTGFP
jgi:Ca2+-binding RTX toxin-like protein